MKAEEDRKNGGNAVKKEMKTTREIREEEMKKAMKER